MSEKSHEETPLCGWAGEYPAAWAALGRSPLPVGLGSCFAAAPRRWVDGNHGRSLRGSAAAGQRLARREEPGSRVPARAAQGCPWSRNPLTDAWPIASGKAPGKRRRSRASAAGPSGPRIQSSPAPGAVPALESWRRRRCPARSQRCRDAPFPRSRPPARSFLPPPPRAPLPAIARVPSAPVTHGPRPGSARPRWVLFPTPPRLFCPPPPASPLPAPALAGSPFLPRPPSFHTNSHSSHSSLPPFKLQGK